MVQVLPYVPSFGERLTPILNDALAKIGQGYGTMRRNRADQAVLDSLKSGDLSDIGMTSAWEKLSPEARKTYEPFLASQLRAKENELKIKQKEEAAKRQDQSKREELLPKFQSVDKLVNEQALNIGNLEAQERLNAEGFWITDQVYTHFNKGVINQAKFENMKDDLAPNANLRPAVNRARLRALQSIAGLPEDISKEKFEKILEKSIKEVKKVEAKENAKASASSEKPDLSEIWGS